MGWLDGPLVPVVAAGIAYVSGLRALLWVADRADRAVPSRMRKALAKRLAWWWDRIEATPLPRLAEREAGAIVARVDAFLARDGHPRSLKIGVSFLLTTLAFLVGNAIFPFARAYGVSLEGLADPAVSGQVSWPETSAALGVQAAFCVLVWRVLRRPEARSDRLYFWSALYLVGFATIPQLNAAAALLFAGFVALVWRLQLADPRRRAALIAVTSLAVLAAHHRLLDALPQRAILLVDDLLVYGANCGFDLLTFSVTLWVLRRLAAGHSFSNLLWIGLDVLLAVLFAVSVYALVLAAFQGSTLPLGPALFDFASYQLGTLNLGLLLFAGTTAIPTLAYAALMIAAHVGRLAHLLAARGSRLILYAAKAEETRTPVYLTFATLALVLSLAPAAVAWFAAKDALAQVAAP